MEVVTLRRVALAAAAAALMVISTGAAHAGGSWLEPSWQRVEPGDELSLTATVYRGALGWVDDGPFFVYLQGDGFGIVTAEGYGGAATDVLLGELQIAGRGQPLGVSIDVAIPEDTPPGQYTIGVCNDPCTTGLGDLVGGALYIGIDPAVDDVDAVGVVLGTDTTSAPTDAGGYLALAPPTDRRRSMFPVWFGISAALSSAVLLVTLISYRR